MENSGWRMDGKEWEINSGLQRRFGKEKFDQRKENKQGQKKRV